MRKKELNRRLKGVVVDVERTDDTRDFHGEKWRKYVYTVELLSFSKRTKQRQIPDSIKGKRVKLVRYAYYDWHYKIGMKKTLTAEETAAVLKRKPIETAFW